MTKLILNIESSSLAVFVRELLSNLRGVKIVSEMESNDSKSDLTKKFIRKYSGAWSGNDTAEEIISIIDENSSSKEPISFD